MKIAEDFKYLTSSIVAFFIPGIRNTSLFFVQGCARKQYRRTYWSARSVIELATIVSLAWYIKMELFRTKQMPESITPTSFRYCTDMEAEIKLQALSVYNDIYRDQSLSRFVLSDTNRPDLDGCRGTIQRYNQASLTYQATIQHRNSESTQNVRMEWMQPLNESSLANYNSKPKAMSTELAVRDLFNKEANSVMILNYHHNVFGLIRKFYDKPEQQHERAYELMKRKLSELDEIEATEKRQLEQDNIQFDQALRTMMNQRKPIQDNPNKRRRYYSSKPAPSVDRQLKSVRDAKYQFILNQIQNQNCDAEQHLFTYPFKTSNSSLHTCFSEGFLSIYDGRDELTEHSLVTCSSPSEPIIVTSSTMKSLSPGNEIEESIIDLALTW